MTAFPNVKRTINISFISKYSNRIFQLNYVLNKEKKIYIL